MTELTIEDAAASYSFVAGEGGAGESPVQMAFDASRSLLAAGLNSPRSGYRIDVLDLSGEAPALAARVETPKQTARPLGFLPDGRLIYSAYFHLELAPLDGGEREQVALSQVDAACVRPDGAVLCHRGRLVMWEGGQLRELEDKRVYSMAGSVDMSPDGKFAVSTANEPYVRLWDVASGKQLKRLTISSGLCYAQFAPDGTAVACGGDEDKVTRAMYVRLLNVDKKWSERAKLKLPSRSYVYGLGFSASGDRLWASQHNIGQSEGVITVWDWRAGVCLHTIKIEAGPARQYARHVAMRADGARVFVTLPEPAARVLVFETP